MQFGKKLFVMAMAAIFIVACLIPFSFEPAMADANIIWTDWTSTDALPLPTEVGNYKLMTDVTISDGTWTVPAGENEEDFNLDLNGHVIKAVTSESCRFSVITVPNGARLNLYDSNPNNPHYFEYNSDGYYTLTNSNNGICVNGGCITGGYTDVDHGADGGGVYVKGAFEMNGGTIIGNRAYKGGGVYVTDGNDFAGRFEMKGGSICGNLAVYGGGVSIYRDGSNYPSFIMSNGTISGNHATNDGGGVHVRGDQDAFKMQGTTISGNMANGNGGGVYVDGGDFQIEGSTSVTGNYKNGTHSASDIAYVAGDSGSDNNVYLDSSQKITVVGALTGGEDSIGVSAHDSGEFVVASGYNGDKLTTDDVACFKSDSSDYSITYDEEAHNYAALLGFYHIHLGTLLNNDAVESATATVGGEVVADAENPTSEAIREDQDVTITFTIKPWYYLRGTNNDSLLECAYDTLDGNPQRHTFTESDGTYSCTFAPTSGDAYIFLADVFSIKNQYEVEYKDATGALPSVTATTLTGNESEIGNASTPTWYVVPEGMTVNSSKLTLANDSTVNLILSDGAELIIGTEDDRVDSNCIYGNGATLNIYGQNAGTGKLDAYNNVELSSAVYVKNLTVNGGILTIDASQNAAICIDNGTFTMNGGIVSAKSAGVYNALKLRGGTLEMKDGSLTATSENNNAIQNENGGSGIKMTGGKLNAINGIQSSISLDYTTAGDSFFATSLGISSLVIAEDKYFTDGENAYSGALTYEQKNAAAGKTLRPANLVSIAAVSNGTVTANKAAVAMNATGNDRTVTLTIAPDSGYELDTLTVTKASGGTVEISGTGDTRTFTIPAENVNVTAIFAFVPIDPTGISLDKHELNVNTRSDSQTLTATIAPEGATGTLVWSSDNPGVASVTDNNDYTATVSIIGIGDAHITVSIDGTNYSDVCTVNVTEYVCLHENRTTISAKNPTCTQTGNNEYYFCNDCRKYLKSDGSTVTTPITGGYAQGKIAELLQKKNLTPSAMQSIDGLMTTPLAPLPTPARSATRK